jgi:hypothetical protein
VEEATEPETEVVDERALSKAKGFFDWTLSFVPAIVSAPSVGAFDEGPEAFASANGLSESCEVPDMDGNAEEAGAGEDIICLKMLEVADDESVLLA